MSIPVSYAKALFDVARDAKLGDAEMDRLEEQIKDLLTTFAGSKEARVALLGPVAGTAEKAAIIEAICAKAGSTDLFKKFLVLLARKDRLPLLAEIGDAFKALRIEESGGVSGQLVSAEPLDQTEINRIAEAMGKKLGKRVLLTAAVDPRLLAGVKVTINGVSYDGSINTQLQRLRDSIEQGAELP